MVDITYNTYIDWYGHGGLSWGLANFSTHVDTTSIYELSTDQIFKGTESLKVTADDSGPTNGLYKSFKVVNGVTYDMDVWVYIPSGHNPSGLDIRFADVDGVFTLTDSTITTDQWVNLTAFLSPFEADQTGYWSINISNAFNAGGNYGDYYVGWTQIRTDLDDVTCDVRTTSSTPTITYGRDAAKELEDIRIGEFTFELDNPDSKYTPGNTGSVLSGLVIPNRHVLVTAEHQGEEYTLYNGYTEDYIIQADLSHQVVEVSCLDIMGKLGTIDVSTDLYPSIRTGDAVKRIMESTDILTFQGRAIYNADSEDLVPLQTYIDSGASTLKWWGFSGKALDGLNEIMESEGPPSIFVVGTSNQIVYKDRLHRQRLSYPATPTDELTGDLNVQGVLAIDEESSADFGWTRIINIVDGSYDNTTVSGEYSDVWVNNGDVSWGLTGETEYVFTGLVENGYYDAQDPVEGVLQVIENPGPDETDVLSGILPEEHDYVLTEGNVSLTSIRRDGTRVEIVMEDETPIGEQSTIKDMTLRAKAVQRESTPLVLRNETSIEEHGGERTESVSLGPVPTPDAEAVFTLYLFKNAFRRPTVTAILRAHNDSYAAFMLGTDLSDLLQVNVTQWFIDEEYTVESVTHRLSENGKDHTIILELLQQNNSRTTTEDVFTFDDPDLGFNNGLFGSAITTPDTVFILGNSQLNSADILTY